MHVAYNSQRLSLSLIFSLTRPTDTAKSSTLKVETIHVVITVITVGKVGSHLFANTFSQ